MVKQKRHPYSSVFVIFVVSTLLLSLGVNFTRSSNTDKVSPPQTAMPPIATYKPQIEPQVTKPPAEPIPAQLVIRFTSNTTQQERAAYIESIGGTVVESIDSLDTVVLTVPEEITQEPLPESPAVEQSEPDYFVMALDDVAPINDPRYAEQWALPAIGAPEAWAQLPTDAAKVTVAVIDSGICASHPDLAGRVADGWDFLESDAVPQDDFGHGCSVAGVIAANLNDSIGIAGVAPNAQVLPLRVLNANGVGSYSDVAAAIVYAADHGAQVINLSLGGSNASTTLEDAVNYAIAKGIIIVAAAGNSGTEGAFYPAAYPEVIAVGSVDPDLQQSSFSNYGSQIDIWAPGRDILTTKRDGGYRLVSGTSFAAPYVAGAESLNIAFGQTLTLEGILNVRTQLGDQVTPPVDISTELPLSTPSVSPPEQQTRTPVANDIEQAILEAIANDGELLAWPGTRLQLNRETIQTAGDWGIGYLDYVALMDGALTNEKPDLIILHRSDGLWTGILPLYKNAVQFNDWLEALPEDLLKNVDKEEWLLPEILIDQEYGVRMPWNTYASTVGGTHDGYARDFYVGGSGSGDQLVAAAAGTVVYVKENSSDDTDNCRVADITCYKKANMVVLRHGSYYTWYVHVKQWSVSVNVDDPVTAGQPIAQEGNTGYSSAPHLHFAVSTCADQGANMFWYHNCVPTQTYSFSSIPGTSATWSSGTKMDASSGGGGGGGTTPAQCDVLRDQTGVRLFREIDCNGTALPYTSPTSINLTDVGWNDVVRSIQIGPNFSVKVWADINQGPPSRCMKRADTNNAMAFWDLYKDYYEGNSGTRIWSSAGAGSNITSIKVYNNETCYEAPQGPSKPTLINPSPSGANIPNPQSVNFDWSDSGSTYDFVLLDGPSQTRRNGLTSSDTYFNSLWPGVYRWYVIAYRSGQSSQSDTWTLNVRPGTPGSVGVSTNSVSAMTVTWGDSAGGVDGYRVYRNGNQIAEVNGGTHSFQDTNLACGTSYTYSVRGYKGSLISDPGSASGSTSVCPVSPTTPAIISPADRTVVVYPQNITFDWSDSGDTYTFHFPGGPSSTQYDVSTSSTTLSAPLAGYYEWFVVAHRNGMDSGPSAFTDLYIVPSAPGSVSVTTNSVSAVTVNWTASLGGVDGYYLYRNGTLLGEVGPNTYSYQVTDLPCANTSTYSVSGYKGFGTYNESPKKEATGITYACPSGPGIPTLLSPTSGSSIANPQSVTFDWSASGDSYLIEITGGPSAVSRSVASDSLNFGSMWPGVYQWRVKAFRNATWSAWSNTWTLNVPPGAPGSVSVTTNSATAVTVNWTNSPGGVDGYRIYRNGGLVATVGSGTYSYQVTGLACGDLSTYAVIGYKGSLNSSQRSASGSTVECPKTVRVLSSFITDGNGTAASLEVGPRIVEGDTQASAIQTDFNAGDNIQLYIEVENQYSTAQTAYFEWIVFDPALREVPELEWRGNLSASPGTTFWLLSTTIPTDVLTGEYTFIAAITFNGGETWSYYDFNVTGIQSVEAIKVYTTDELGAAGLDTEPVSGKTDRAQIKLDQIDNVSSSSIKNTFNAGDPIKLYIDFYNNVAEDEIASYEWSVTDPWGRPVWGLSYANNLNTHLFDGWWRLNRVIPANAITGTYQYVGSITHNGRTTSKNMTFYVNGAPGPVNDGFGSPTVIGRLPYVVSQDTWGATNATADPAPTCGSGKNSNSVWYRYTPSSNGLLEVSTWGSNYDTVLTVWADLSGNLTEVGCNDDVYDYFAARLENIPVMAGVAYYIEVMDYDDPGGGNLELYIDFAPSVSNDEFNSPVTINTNPARLTLNTGAATKASDDPPLTTCNRLPGEASVWYRYTPTSDGELQLNTKGSDYDTLLAIWTGTQGSLSLHGCNDDVGDVNGGWDQDSILNVQVAAGTTYYIQVSTYAGMIDINGASAMEMQNKLEVLNSASASTWQEEKEKIDKSGGVVMTAQDNLKNEVSAVFWGAHLNLNSRLVSAQASPATWYLRGIGPSTYGTAGDIPMVADYNGDGKDEIAVFRPSNGTWYLRGVGPTLYGTPEDLPVPADYNGDGIDDIAVFRPSNGTWYLRGIGPTVYGTPEDIPVPADYNGDGKADIAVFRPSNGTWYIKGMGATVYGMTGDIPVPADYNGDGKAEIAVFRPSNGTWYIKGMGAAVYGTPEDIPVPADYNGDGKAEMAVYRPSNGTWYIKGMGATVYGVTGDAPVVGDYNGDSKDEIAVFRP